MIKKRWDDTHPYTRGSVFWEKNAFWRTGMYSAKVQAEYETWLEGLRGNEKQLTRLEANIPKRQ